MAIDSLNQISNEQLLAMNMIGNGQVTNDSNSDSTSSTSNETNLAFQSVMQNLLESSKNSKQNNATTVSDSINAVSNKSKNDNESNNSKSQNTSNVTRVGQKYATGQNLEDLPMILKDSYVNFTKNSGSILSNRSDVDRTKIYNAVNSASEKYGVDSNLILAIIKQESDFQPNAKSSSGASGLMQLMPENFKSAGITDGYDVNQNVNGGTKLFKEYLNQFDGNKEMALMAYNAGPGTMQKRGVSSTSDLYKMPQETQNYVPKVMGYYINGV